jgi:hypothetical protein
VKFEFSVAGDASDGGFFVYRVNSKQRLFSRPFTAVESQESSAFKELTAVHETWTNEDILAKFSGKNCWTFIDNKAVTFIFVGRFWEPWFAEIIFRDISSLKKVSYFLGTWVSRENKIFFYV